MQLNDKERKFLEDYGPWIYATLFYWFVAANDWFSSILASFNPDLQEVNEFARDVNMHFVLHKGVVIDVLFFSALLCLGAVIYLGLKPFNKYVAQVASCVPVVWMAANRLLDAVVPNYLLDLHFSVPDKHLEELIKKVLGI